MCKQVCKCNDKCPKKKKKKEGIFDSSDRLLRTILIVGTLLFSANMAYHITMDEPIPAYVAK